MTCLDKSDFIYLAKRVLSKYCLTKGTDFLMRFWTHIIRGTCAYTTWAWHKYIKHVRNLFFIIFIDK